jgi:hypothetical protein
MDDPRQAGPGRPDAISASGAVSLTFGTVRDGFPKERNTVTWSVRGNVGVAA